MPKLNATAWGARWRCIPFIQTAWLSNEIPDDRRLVYHVSNPGSTEPKVIMEASNIFHIRGLGEDGPVGLDVISYAVDSIGWTKAAQLFGSSFFGNGAQPQGILQVKRNLSEPALQGLRTEFKKLYGGPYNSNNIPILPIDTEYKPISIEPDKGQFIQTNEFLIDEICRWFGVPPHKVGHLARATFSNIEHQSIEVVTDAVMPWVDRFCDEANVKLLGTATRHTRMDVRELLRADTTVRTAYYRDMRNIGALSVNDIRRLEGIEGIGADGEKYVMQSQYTELSKIGEEPEPVAAPVAAPAPVEDDDESEDESEENLQASEDRRIMMEWTNERQRTT